MNTKHFVIRLLILAVVCIGTGMAIFYSSPSDLPQRSNPALGTLILVAFEIIIASIWFVVEAIVFHFKKQQAKRNADLLLFLLIGLPTVIFWIFFVARKL
jgi:ABC-type phosphate transport system permease subunit